MGKRGLIILGGSINELPLLIKAREKKYYTYLIDMDTEAAGSRVADKTINLSTKDIESIKRFIDTLSEEDLINICGVGAIDTDVNKTIAAISSYINLKHFNYTMSDLVANKYKLYTLLKAYKDKGLFEFNLIDTKLIWLFDEVKKDASKKMLVLKPTENMGGLGVIKTDQASAYSSFLYVKRHSPNGEVILQSYMPGNVYKIQYLVGNEQSVHFTSWKITNISSMYFIERYRENQIETQIHEKLINYSNDIIQKIKLRNTPCEFKFIVNKGDIYFLDLNLRLEGGFLVDNYIKEIINYDLLENYISIITGNEPKKLSTKKSKSLAVYKVYPNEKIGSKPSESVEFSVMREFPDVLSSKYYSKVILCPKSMGKGITILSSTDDESAGEKSFLAHAVKNLSGKCKVCKICDGKGCLGEIPGMGGVLQNESFISNYENLRKHAIPVELLSTSKIAINKNFFGNTVRFPLFIAPISGVQSNLGNAVDEKTFYLSLLKGAREWGTYAFIGDGSKNDKYLFMADILKEVNYEGVITLKPRLPLDYMLQKIEYFNDTSLCAVCIDIDSITLPTMNKSDIGIGRYSLSDIEVLLKASKKPIIIKGIMDYYDILKLAKAGVNGIIISNHGGRSLSSIQSSFEFLLSSDMKYIKMKFPNTLLGFDGGIRNGEDIIKVLIQGIDFVLVGRPFAIFAAGGKHTGVLTLFEKYYKEIEATLKLTGND